MAAGIDRKATCALWRDPTTPGYVAGTVRSIVVGAVWTRARLHESHLAASPICQHCRGAEAEDAEHLWWQCPAWQEMRDCFRTGCLAEGQPLPTMATQATSGIPLARRLADAPACLRLCGVMPEDCGCKGVKI